MNHTAQIYARSAHSHNLKSDATHHDTDMLAAIALTSELGSLLFSVKYANQVANYGSLLRGWEGQVKIKATHAKWPNHVNQLVVAKSSLDYWLNDICPCCEGRGKARMPFVDHFSDSACELCDGSGKKPVPVNRHIYAYVGRMIQELEEMTRKAGDDAVRKLAHKMDI